MPPPLLTVGQFRANLWSGGKNCPRPMCVPYLKIVALPVSEILTGSQNFEIGAPAPGDAQFRANLWSGGKYYANCHRWARACNDRPLGQEVKGQGDRSRKLEVWR